MALQVRIKSLIDFADHEVVVDYKGFGLGWSWHGVEVTLVSSGGFKTPNLAFPQSSGLPGWRLFGPWWPWIS